MGLQVLGVLLLAHPRSQVVKNMKHFCRDDAKNTEDLNPWPV